MSVLFERSKGLTDVKTHYCPGCSHGIVHRLLAECLEEMGELDNAIAVSPVGCAVLALDYFEFDGIQAAHGRAPATATGIKRVHPDKTVITYQGDGDLASIGMCEIVNDAENWSLKGSYKIAKPLGYRCTLAYQGDVVIITEDGYMPLSKVLPLNQASNSAIAFSDKIRGLVLDRTSKNKNKDGWQAIIYQRGGYAIFNVPVYGNYEQHVININNGSWCRFTNIKSYCWELYEGRLYFGSDYGVYLFDDGYSDAGNHIFGEVEQAYSDFGYNGLKKIQLLNPRTKSSTQYALVIYTNVDYDEQQASYAENVGISGVTKWNEAKWSCLKNPIGTKWQNF